MCWSLSICMSLFWYIEVSFGMYRSLLTFVGLFWYVQVTDAVTEAMKKADIPSQAAAIEAVKVVCCVCIYVCMGWLWLVGSIKL